MDQEQLQTLISDGETGHVSYVMLKSFFLSHQNAFVIGYCMNCANYLVLCCGKYFSYIRRSVVVMHC